MGDDDTRLVLLSTAVEHSISGIHVLSDITI